MTKNKMLKMCHPRKGGELCWHWYDVLTEMDSRFRGKDNIIFCHVQSFFYENNTRLVICYCNISMVIQDGL